MKKSLLFFFLYLFIFFSSNAQRYLVRFKDKGSSNHTLANPSQYLSQKAIDRRLRFSIAIDSTDLPVTSRYLDSIASVPGVSILNTSKWLNQVSISVTDANAITKINSFPFVLVSARIASRLRTDVRTLPEKQLETPNGQISPSTERLTNDFFSYGNSFGQIHLHNGEFLHNIGLRGQNITIGMLDAGFQNYTSVTGFDSARNNGQILGTWDFVAGNASVAEDHSHGEECLSIIAGNIPGTFVGSAPKANFYLFKTEDTFSEYPIEEHNWVCGAERLDSAGGDLISSSLGYRTFDDPSLDHTYSQMNGNTTMAAIGADLAAKKGILVVCAAGNDGSNGWHYLLTPADGDSVMAVGAVNVGQQVWPNSSYGPSSDGQVKPDVASVGWGTILQYSNNAIGGGNGTSYACPNMAGLTACLMQGFPEFNNMKIINAIRQSGNNVAAPNDRIGYGIPDMKKALMSLIKDFASASASINNCQASISWLSKDMGAMKYEIERKSPGETSFTKIGETAGTGIAFSNHNYTVSDILYGVSAGTALYRIKQIIDTAALSFTADYIDTISVEVNSLCSLNDLDVLLNTLKQTATSSASFSDCKVLLKWSSSDVNGMKYEIERKTATESTFKKIGETQASGTVFTTHNYQFNEGVAGMPAGTVSYRIKQVVDTAAGSFKADYIDTTTVDVSPSCALTDFINLSPNPAHDKFILQTTIDRPIQHFAIRITNSIGQTVSTFNKTKNIGIVNFTFPVSQLAGGKYFVSVYENGHLLATKPLIIIK